MIDYLKDFRNSRYAAALVTEIQKMAPSEPLTLMEVCGGHTIAIFRFGLHDLLPESIRLISGPGCPVCVTENTYIDKAIAIARMHDTVICTFGDMLKVPGTETSLQAVKAEGRDIRICLSPVEAVEIAAANPGKRIIFLGIGFETTAPTIAVSVKMAREHGLQNFFVLTALKTMPHALAALIDGPGFNVHGFICPGHVTTITGIKIYDTITSKYHIPCVVSGFEPLDILESIRMLVAQINAGVAGTEIQYTRSVPPGGNALARAVMEEVFIPCDASWRGLGLIPASGLRMQEEFAAFDADREFTPELPVSHNADGCICGAIMRGVLTPPDCTLFATACHPLSPRGACMVSGEGTCATYYKYNRGVKHGV